MPADAPTRGCIVTFYSYKGGTGRTMALANVACLLAEPGDRVLVVDWDLEAPGLHRFFPPRLQASVSGSNLGLDDSPGVIDLFSTVRDQLPSSPPSSEEEAEAAVERGFAGVDLEAYIRETAVPGVRIMRAGRNDDGGYSRRVGTFNWEDIFERAPGVYREFAERLTARYRWVLVDSRTGVTDISGICTSLLPERLVVVFTPNRQSLTGVRELVLEATRYRRASDDLRPLLVYPLPSRIEASLQDLRTRWRFGDADRDIIGYQPMFQDLFRASYGLAECGLEQYFDEVQIQQTPDYAYGEEIAVRRPGDRFSMANSYTVFANRLKTGEPPWQASTSVQFAEAVTSSPRQSVSAKSEPEPRAAADHGHRVFVSYAPADRERVGAIANALTRRGLRVSIDKSIEPGTDYSRAIGEQLDASEAIVVCWSRNSIESAWVKTEAGEGLRRGILVPVLLDDVDPPLAFRSLQAADLRRPTTEAFARLADAVARVAAGTAGSAAYPSSFAPTQVQDYAPAAGASVARTVRKTPRVALAAAALVVLGVSGWFGLRTFSGSRLDPGATPPPSKTATPLPPVTTPPPQNNDSAPTPVTATEPPSPKPAPPLTGKAAPPEQMITVPNFVGSSSDDVTTAASLIGLALVMSDGRGRLSPELVGVVTKQTPAAGTSVARGSRIVLELASRTVTVPTLVGTTLDSAVTVLTDNQLQLGKTSSRDVADARPGTIVEQSERPGASVPAGTTIDVVVAVQRAATVPDVRNLSLAAAFRVLDEARLSRGNVTRRRNNGPPGVVLDQSPAPRTRVRPGTPVHLGVSVAVDPPPNGQNNRQN